MCFITPSPVGEGWGEDFSFINLAKSKTCDLCKSQIIEIAPEVSQ
jgi:hypothetical protein